jgi:hypothetical protein
VILQCSDASSAPEIRTLNQLYPYASPTARMSRQLAIETAQAYEETLQSLMSQPFPPFKLPSVLQWTTVQQVYQAACAAARDFVTHDNVYPIRFAAALAGVSGENISSIGLSIPTTVQVPALEYGCTQDAVCQVLQVLRRNEQDTHSVVFLVQVDQWGLPHAPFAMARNVFCERSSDVICFVLVGMPLRIVQGTELYPTLPAIF